MFKRIRNELTGIRVAVAGVASGVRVLSERPQPSADTNALADRVSSLEGAIESIRGLVEAGLVEAGAIKSAARASEERARGHMKRAEGYVKLAESVEGSEEEDPFETIGKAYADILPPGNDEGSEGLPPMPNGLEGRREGLSMVRAAKRGR